MVSDKLNEECGVFGLYAKNQVDTFSLMQFGLIALQHRGQEACGISFLSKNNIYSFKKEGLVIEAFSLIDNPELYQGNAAIGHTRYSTTGGQSKRNIQPLFTKNETCIHPPSKGVTDIPTFPFIESFLALSFFLNGSVKL